MIAVTGQEQLGKAGAGIANELGKLVQGDVLVAIGEIEFQLLDANDLRLALRDARKEHKDLLYTCTEVSNWESLPVVVENHYLELSPVFSERDLPKVEGGGTESLLDALVDVKPFSGEAQVVQPSLESLRRELVSAFRWFWCQEPVTLDNHDEVCEVEEECFCGCLSFL